MAADPPCLYFASRRARLLGGSVGAVQDADGGADVHIQGDAVVGVADHPRYVSSVKFPGKQGGGAEHMPQAVPGPVAVAVRVAPSGRQVGGLEDLAAVVGGPPVLPRPGGEDQAQRVGAGGFLGAGLLEAGGKPFGQRVASRSRSGVMVRRRLRFFGASR
jgi:hypothetical protein